MPAKAGISLYPSCRLPHEMPAFAGMTKDRMDHATRLKRLRFRAWHRGTKEADLMLGGFFDACHADWSEEEVAWFEALNEEQDVDIMGWAIGTIAVPDRWRGAMMERLRMLDYIPVEK